MVGSTSLSVKLDQSSQQCCAAICCVALQGVFELLCNFSLIPEWDVLFKSGRYLSYVCDPAGRCEVAYIHIVYGLPGEQQGWCGANV